MLVFQYCELSRLSSKQRMFPNRSVVVLVGLLPGLVLVVAPDHRSTSYIGGKSRSVPSSYLGSDVLANRGGQARA